MPRDDCCSPSPSPTKLRSTSIPLNWTKRVFLSHTGRLDGMAESNSASFPHTTPNGSSRHEKSLGLLTVKFVTLLQEAKDGVLDLKVVG